MTGLRAARYLPPTTPGSTGWHDQRAQGLGGSDASAILGLSKWTSPLDVWMLKTGRSAPQSDSPSEAAEWGKRLEDIVADALEAAMQDDVDPMLYLRHPEGTMQNVERPWMLANLDRLVFHEEREDEGAVAGAEIKTVGTYGAAEWSEPDGMGKHALVQCVHYMAVTGLERFYVGCLVAGQRFVWRVLERDPLLEEQLLEAETTFWALVQSDTPPSVAGDASEATSKALGRMWDKAIPESSVEFDRHALDLWCRRRDLAAQIDNITAQRDAIDNELKAVLQDNEAGLVNGDVAVRWTNVATNRLDTKALKAEMPEVAEKFTKTSTSRRFSVK